MSSNRLTERQKTIDTWLRAAVNFYGYVTPRVFLTLFNRGNSPKLLKAELLEHAEKLMRQKDCSYCIYTNAIVNTDVDEDKMSDIYHMQQGKKYYMPTSEELLKYLDLNYYERTPQTNAMYSYLCMNIGMNMFSATSFMSRLSLLHRIEENTGAQMKLFESFGIRFKDIMQANEVFGLIANMSNHTRKWANCGHTPEELYSLYSAEK